MQGEIATLWEEATPVSPLLRDCRREIPVKKAKLDGHYTKLRKAIIIKLLDVSRPTVPLPQKVPMH